MTTPNEPLTGRTTLSPAQSAVIRKNLEGDAGEPTLRDKIRDTLIDAADFALDPADAVLAIPEIAQALAHVARYGALAEAAERYLESLNELDASVAAFQGKNAATNPEYMTIYRRWDAAQDGLLTAHALMNQAARLLGSEK